MRTMLLGLTLLTTLAGCAATQYREPAIARITPEELARILPKPVPSLSLDEVVAMTRRGQTPDAIIEAIKASGSQYDLTPSQVLELHQQGVDAAVLDYMHSSHEQALRDRVADEINKRERENQMEQKRLQREYQLRSEPYFYPYFGYGYAPYWRYDPFYGYYGFRRW